MRTDERRTVGMKMMMRIKRMKDQLVEVAV
jgi:hypothetical protein